MAEQISIKYRQEFVGIRTLKTKYIAEVTHRGLNDYKVFSSDDDYILQNKVNAHVAKLNEKWEKQEEKRIALNSKEANLKEAEEKTQAAIYSLKNTDEILSQAIDNKSIINFEKLKDKGAFKTPSPEMELNNRLAKIKKTLLSLPEQPNKFNYSGKPNQDKYKPKFSLLDKLLKSRKERKIQDAHNLFEKDLLDWKVNCLKIDELNEKNLREWKESCLKIDSDNKKELFNFEQQQESIKKDNSNQVKYWERIKAEFIENQKQQHTIVDRFKENYLKGEKVSVLAYCNMVLKNSKYPEDFPKKVELDYSPETKILIVEYSLPSFEHFPTLNEVKFIKNELKEYYISDAQIQKMFDATMYKITLRTLYELFSSDVANAIEAISFNGWVDSLNKSTGKRENTCILSIQVKKAEFMEVDLRHVDPKACFKSLKGIGSSKLSGLTPIQPVLQINRTDKRFTSHYDVADSIDESTNLAAMDWEDFEHLIREIFAKEFSSNGGEVKVTQASRDGGVDAIAFDPDPIRGGKIVIQAKRYTNTVGVSAVRDLYGTVMNEGATKGILVTTTDYGSDSYEFAKGKPLTLMNGANLLYLLEKHGHHARIDIKEAKSNRL